MSTVASSGNVALGTGMSQASANPGVMASGNPTLVGNLSAASSVNAMKLVQPITSSSIGLDTNQILNKQRLQDLVREVDVNEQLDDDVEEMLLQIADDFIENVVTHSCMFAKHRKANTLEVKDVQLNLEKYWNIWIPGFGSDELRPYKKANVTEAHKQRLALIRKTLKKY